MVIFYYFIIVLLTIKFALCLTVCCMQFSVQFVAGG